MLGVDVGWFLIFIQMNNAVARLKLRFAGELETSRNVWMIPDKGEIPVIFIKSRDDGIRPVGKPDVVSQIDRAADDKERERQRKHGDEQKPAPQASDHGVRRCQTISLFGSLDAPVGAQRLHLFSQIRNVSPYQLRLLCRWKWIGSAIVVGCASPGVL